MTCEEWQTWYCPICRVPLTEGEKCECGTRIEGVPLLELPEYFHNFTWEMFSLQLLQVSPEWGNKEEQRAIFMIIPPVDPQPKDVVLNIYMPSQDVNIDWAIYNLIEEYKYRKDCGLVKELKEKYEGEIKKWKINSIKVTAGQKMWIARAASYWGISMRVLVSLFLAWVLNDEMFQPYAGD